MTEPVRPLEALIDKIFVAGQMDAQGHAAEKFKIGSGGTVLAFSRSFLKEARDELAALLQAAAPPERLSELQHLASAMRKVLPPALLAEVAAHLDPLTPFVEYLRSAAHPAVEPREEPDA